MLKLVNAGLGGAENAVRLAEAKSAANTTHTIALRNARSVWSAPYSGAIFLFSEISPESSGIRRTPNASRHFTLAMLRNLIENMSLIVLAPPFPEPGR